MSTSTLIPLIGFATLAVIAGLLPFARRFVLLLTAKYLVKRRLAWVSLIAVALCVALVLIVLSVMGGWLNMFRDSFRTLSGDLIVSKNQNGFGLYPEMIAEIEKLPDVQSAVPLIETYGLLSIPGADWTHFVSVVGLPMEKIDTVMQFSQSLWYQHDIVNYDRTAKVRSPIGFQLWDNVPYAELTPNDKRALSRPGMIVGAGAIAVHKDLTGKPTWPTDPPLNYFSSTLTVVPGNKLEDNNVPAATSTQYWIVDGSRTQTPQHDESIYVPFDQLQADLNMTASEYQEVLPTTRKGEPMQTVTRVEPARCSSIQIKVRPGVKLEDVKPKIQAIVRNVTGALSGGLGGIKVQTWEEQQAQFLTAIEHEIALTTTLFALISVVAVFMIFCIFYTIVAEKTRDIGILKAVGGSAWGVAQIFLTYGAAIGFVGGALGIAISYFFVRYINQIHGLITRITGTQIYNSEVYAFDKLPDHLNWSAAIVIWVIGIAAAILGAVVPAIRAARLNPVDALRFE